MGLTVGAGALTEPEPTAVMPRPSLHLRQCDQPPRTLYRPRPAGHAFGAMLRTLLLATPVCAAFLLGACDNSPPRAPVVRMGLGGTSAGVATVQDGDNLWVIARRYNLPLRDIIVLNRIRAPFIIHPGDRLQLPPPREYTVKQGDSLYVVSRLFSTDMRAVARLNHMSPPYILQEGQVLRMPSPTRPEGAAYDSPARTAYTAPRTARPSNLPGHKPLVAQEATYNRAVHVPARANARFFSPVQGNLVSAYGPKPGGLHNDGINIAAPRGTPVRAAENGVVAYVGDEIEGYGNLVLVRHEDGFMTAYAHLSETAVKRGDTTMRGAVIGKVGATGNVDTPQLHFEIRKGAKALDPQSYL